MKYALPLFITILFLASCKPYQMDIPQGKNLSAQQISEIHTGMTKESVLYILGSPLQGASPFDANRLDYIYTFQKNGGDIHEKRLSIYFKDNLVSKIVQEKYVMKK